MKVWVDLSNSPHPLLFEPIVRDLEARGDEVVLTARDHAQTAQLARERFPDVTVIGAPSGAGRVRKAAVLGRRVADLGRWARRERPDVAVSHGSYAQIVAARALRLPVLTAMDFEFQPANHLAFRLAHRILVPEALPADELARCGAKPPKLVRYAGYKEDIYLGESEPDPSALAAAGIDLADGDILAVARSAPAGAAYHPDENPLFEQCVRELDSQPRVTTVVLARHAEQREALRGAGLQRTLIPEQALDSRALLARADVFVGAGGTMTREAALLGVPTWSLFAGRMPAVDAALIDAGAIKRLEAAADVAGLEPVPGGDRAAGLAEVRRRGAEIRAAFLRETDAIA
jgi:predicted glycosyltransferase